MRRSEINDLFSRHNHAAIARALEVLLSYGKVKRAKILDGFGRPAEMWWAV